MVHICFYPMRSLFIYNFFIMKDTGYTFGFCFIKESLMFIYKDIFYAFIKSGVQWCAGL
jgi:hypothetical protein